MIREQATIKTFGTEIPLIALDDWRFWVLTIVICGMVWLWKKN